MKKINKYISLAMMAIFAFSSIAYSLIQSNRFGSTQQTVELPENNIINYKLNDNQRYLAIQKGYTIILLEYNDTLDPVKGTLESYASKLKNQIILEEIQSNRTYVDFQSMRGELDLLDPSVNQTVDVLCEILLNPPMECALRQV